MIIGNGPVITNDPANPFVADGAVVVQGDSIVAVGPAAEIRAAHPAEAMVDVGGRVIMAGLINAHTHAYSAYARGMAVHQPTGDFTEILENLWWRLDRLLTLEDVELNAGTTFIECIRNGVTTVFDHHSSPNAVSGSLQTVADVAARIGIRTSLCYETSDRDGAVVFAAAIEENASFMKKVNTGEQDMRQGPVRAARRLHPIRGEPGCRLRGEGRHHRWLPRPRRRRRERRAGLAGEIWQAHRPALRRPRDPRARDDRGALHPRRPRRARAPQGHGHDRCPQPALQHGQRGRGRTRRRHARPRPACRSGH